MSNMRLKIARKRLVGQEGKTTFDWDRSERLISKKEKEIRDVFLVTHQARRHGRSLVCFGRGRGLGLMYGHWYGHHHQK